jgi:hypothetical protein
MFCHDIAAADGIEWETVNLVVGGCELHRHWQYWSENDPHYALEINGKWVRNEVTIKEMLEDGTYDIITTQQASHHSGRPETYFPFVVDLCQVFREYQPDAKLYLQETWAYEWDSTHGAFPNYDCSQSKMYQCICDTVDAFSATHQIPVIPAGKLIQNLRQTPEFDYANGGLSLCRDGFHMNLTYGRYAVACAWFETLLGGNSLHSTYAPDQADPHLIDMIREEAHKLCGK